MEDSSTTNGEDWISWLPDSLLCHVLSFLSPKEVVGTSILSKRWENLWTSVPSLYFCDTFTTDCGNYMNKVNCFIDYVNWVLAHRDGFAIEKCNFSCYTLHASAHLYSWTCAVIACMDQELTIKSELFRVGQLPWCLLTCKALVVLKIHGRFVLNFPTFICLPRLKFLYLNSVIYGDDASMQKLFSSCPVLEDLVIKRHDWDGVGIMNISVPSLKRLSIFSLSLRSIGNYEYKVVINTPNLEYLEIDDYMYEDYSVNSSPSLVEACIQGTCVLGILDGISQVKLLALSGDAMQSLHNIVPILPTFHNLTHLKLGIDDNVGWELLPNILQSSPNLKVLNFKEGLVKPFNKGSFQFSWNPPRCVPYCLLLHLKTIEIHNFLGTTDEVKLVKYLLRHAKVLELTTIYWYDLMMDSESQTTMVKTKVDISKSPRGSNTCQLIFHHLMY